MYIDDQLFGMSSYCKYFFRIKKYDFGAFQRRIGRHRVAPGYDFKHLYTSPIKWLKTCTNVVKNSPGQRKARYIALFSDQASFLPSSYTFFGRFLLYTIFLSD